MSLAVEVRAARIDDATFSAPLIRLSLGGLSDHLFDPNTDIADGMIAKLFARDAGRFGYRQAYLAEIENERVAVLAASHGKDLNRLGLASIPHLIAVMGLFQAIRSVYRAVTLPGGWEAMNDEYYIANIGVLPAMQGRSIGSQLLVYAEGLAKKNSLMKCSLIVGSHNPNARRLYERVGYDVVETVQDPQDKFGYFRMVKEL